MSDNLNKISTNIQYKIYLNTEEASKKSIDELDIKSPFKFMCCMVMHERSTTIVSGF
jgi:hypothetical protein